MQISSNVSKYVRICSNICPNMLKYCTYISKSRLSNETVERTIPVISTAISTNQETTTKTLLIQSIKQRNTSTTQQTSNEHKRRLFF